MFHLDMIKLKAISSDKCANTPCAFISLAFITFTENILFDVCEYSRVLLSESQLATNGCCCCLFEIDTELVNNGRINSDWISVSFAFSFRPEKMEFLWIPKLIKLYQARTYAYFIYTIRQASIFLYLNNGWHFDIKIALIWRIWFHFVHLIQNECNIMTTKTISKNNRLNWDNEPRLLNCLCASFKVPHTCEVQHRIGEKNEKLHTISN